MIYENVNSLKSLRSWKTIGVVGKSNTKDHGLLANAYKVGAHLSRLGHAVLTGGHHRHVESSVKYQALLGAISLQNEMSCVRLIGVVPKNISAQLRPPITVRRIESDDGPSMKLRYIYIHTQLKSEERDPITGEVADALIALCGESGTPREVAAALMAGRPVVFFNSLEFLKEKQ
ncbi:MAG: hypothetical protein CFE39_03870 [Comamonadaceae bacterium PBBC2]|nr:MAG: hypothetical protein CFE39_03870 [Comamonadaceae bacterium PBBC2]